MLVFNEIVSCHVTFALLARDTQQVCVSFGRICPSVCILIIQCLH